MPPPRDDLPLSPLDRYRRDLAREDFVADTAQARAVEALQKLYRQLIDHPPRRRFASSRLIWPKVKGLYLWGGVGRGKTYLMDSFFSALPFTRKQRTHFHRFMLEVHERRRDHPDAQDPLLGVAADIAERIRVLCLDEFQVTDIGDAMILGRLLEGLFDNGVTLVTTSNVAPDDLYRDGLQRERFLPTIELLKNNLTVLNVDGGHDYRLREMHTAEVYLVPYNQLTETKLRRRLARLAPHGYQHGVDLEINYRRIPARFAADGVAWFDFKALCAGPRSNADYVELARMYSTLIISAVPVMDDDHLDWVRRFVDLIDELYDRGVKLIIAAAAPPTKLYTGSRLRGEFERTASRLIEMQSEAYLAKAHVA